MNFQVSFKKDTHSFTVLPPHPEGGLAAPTPASTVLAPDATLLALQTVLLERFQIPVLAQKLFLRGKRLDQLQSPQHPRALPAAQPSAQALSSDNSGSDSDQESEDSDDAFAKRQVPLVQLDIRAGDKILLVGASQEEIDALRALEAAVEAERQAKREARRKALSATPRRSHSQRPSGGSSSNFGTVQQFGFGRLEVLQQFHTPPPSEALRLLERLQNDPGIVGVMKKYKWSVGSLVEMPPEGKVGIDDVCVLGFNVNKGESIALRLRTDDLTGFRKYDVIKKTLVHELTHMVHSEHNQDFFTLNSLLTKEADQMDWTKSGRALGGRPVYVPSPESAQPDVYDWDRAEFGDDFGSDVMAVTAQSSGQRLGSLNPAGPSAGISARDRIAQAALARHTETKSSVGPSSDRRITVVDVVQPKAKSPAPEHSPAHSHPQQPTEAVPMDTRADASATSLASELGSLDKVEKLRRLLAEFKRSVALSSSGVALEAALSTLAAYLKNILAHPDDTKYRAIRLHNAVFQSRVAPFSGGVELLKTVGFQPEGDTLRLVSVDPGLVWMAVSLIGESV